MLPRQAELKTIYHATYRKAVALHLELYLHFDGQQYHLIEMNLSSRSVTDSLGLWYTMALRTLHKKRSGNIMLDMIYIETSRPKDRGNGMYA
ncbi:hypothetical protein TNCV_4117591 [Trichonephila clavipes]|nr:hypothetical protein TNCV_4117591 [Trichonephila clavipes]